MKDFFSEEMKGQKGYEQKDKTIQNFKLFSKCPLPGDYAKEGCTLYAYYRPNGGELYRGVLLVSGTNQMQLAIAGEGWMMFCNKGMCPSEDTIKALKLQL